MTSQTSVTDMSGYGLTESDDGSLSGCGCAYCGAVRGDGADGDGAASGGVPLAALSGVLLSEIADAAAGTSTGYALMSGDVFEGSISSGSDSDWIEVSLTAGQTYTFGMVGLSGLHGGLDNPLLRLRDAAGAELQSDDNGGPGLFSNLTFTASASGTYYLDAQASDTGSYRLSMVDGDRASYDMEMIAAVLERPDRSWASAPQDPVNITWGVRASGNDPSNNSAGLGLTASQVAATEDAMAYIDGILGLTFTRVAPGGTTNDATMLFGHYSASDGAGAYAYYPGSTSSGSVSGDVWYNDSVSDTDAPMNSYTRFVILHEIGHALGIAHPGDYNAAPGVSITYANNAQFAQDSRQYSVMSYFDDSATTTNIPGYADTFLIADFLALHNMYGADMTFNAGDTTYGFNATNTGTAEDFTANTTPIMTIWDGAGTDLIDLSGYSGGQTLTLEAGVLSDVGGYSGNFSIAFGAVIENAIGTDADDTLTGNAADNWLRGGEGRDTLQGGAGNDLLQGGDEGGETYGGTGLLADNGSLGNTSRAAAVSLDGLFSSAANPDIQNATGAPHVTVDGDLGAGTGGNARYYSFTVLDDGTRVIVDVDGAESGAEPETFDAWVEVYDDTGTRVAFDDDHTVADPGSAGTLDSLVDTVLDAGTYTVAIGSFSGLSPLSDGDTWEMHVSLYGRATGPVTGGAGGDTLDGGAGNDRLEGGQGDDVLRGGTGIDRLIGGAGADEMDGGLGNDVYYIDQAGDTIVGEADFSAGGGIDTVYSDISYTLSNNLEVLRLTGTGDIDAGTSGGPAALVGQAGSNVLRGAGGDDALTAKGGNDVLVGGDGRDTLVGDAGADRFDFNSLSNSRAGQASRDFINGFSNGSDKIDLSDIDANPFQTGDQAWDFIGTAGFTGAGSASAGELRWFTFGGGNFNIVQADWQGDGVADMEIFVNLTATMSVADFIL